MSALYLYSDSYWQEILTTQGVVESKQKTLISLKTANEHSILREMDIFTTSTPTTYKAPMWAYNVANDFLASLAICVMKCLQHIIFISYLNSPAP